MGTADTFTKIAKRIGSSLMVIAGEHPTEGTVPLTESEYSKIYDRKILSPISCHG